MSRHPVSVEGRVDAAPFKHELLGRLGLRADASMQDVEAAHNVLVDFLELAPRKVTSWAAARTADVDEAFAPPISTLTRGTQSSVPRRVFVARSASWSRHRFHGQAPSISASSEKLNMILINSTTPALLQRLPTDDMPKPYAPAPTVQQRIYGCTLHPRMHPEMRWGTLANPWLTRSYVPCDAGLWVVLPVGGTVPVVRGVNGEQVGRGGPRVPEPVLQDPGKLVQCIGEQVCR